MTTTPPTTLPAKPPAPRMATVDGIRAIAALAVILPHAWVLFHDVADRPGAAADVVAFVRVYGTLGVQVFFVLSGFVIAYSLRNATVTARFFGRFVARRSIRLDPPYWAGLAICCGVLWVQVHVARDGSAMPTPRQVLLHLAYLQQIAGCNDAINHTYWTLCMEIQMYLAFCGAIGLLQRVRVPYRPVLTAAFAASLAWPLAWPVPWTGWTVFGLFLPQAYGFLAGAVAWWFVEGRVDRAVAIALAGGGAALAARHGDAGVLLVCGTATLLGVGGRRGALDRWLAFGPLQSLGRASYGLYLLHNPVIAVALMVRRRFPGGGLPIDVALLAAVCAVSVAAAAAMHVAIERPCLRWARRLRTEPGPLVPLVPT